MKTLLYSVLEISLQVLLLLSGSFAVVTCITGPLNQAITIGITTLATLAALCGLCLRLSSAIEVGIDKKLALQCGEKLLLTLLLFATLLSLKYSFEVIGLKEWLQSGTLSKYFNVLKYIVLFVIATLVLITFFSTIGDICKLMVSRLITWKK